MNKEDLKVGEIYCSNYSKTNWLVKYAGKGVCEIDHAGYMTPDTGYFSASGSGWGDWKQFKEGLREATQFEKDWLNECIKQKGYVPKEMIKAPNTYPIYL